MNVLTILRLKRSLVERLPVRLSDINRLSPQKSVKILAGGNRLMIKSYQKTMVACYLGYITQAINVNL
ncbi:MAG TPA: hypothetical protein DD640_10175, partial [Clostridiales bacterium]|nr:hypothetical protein [Clostridiales bacterium]